MKSYRWAQCFLARMDKNRIHLVGNLTYRLRLIGGRMRMRSW